MADTQGVLIGDEASYVRLTRLGSRRIDDSMTSVSIEVKGGPFEGTVCDDTLVGISDFCEALSRLHNLLSGEAKLGSYDKFKLMMSGNGRGAIHVSVQLYGEHVPLSMLKFDFEIDQTYLPTIITQLRDEFPDG